MIRALAADGEVSEETGQVTIGAFRPTGSFHPKAAKNKLNKLKSWNIHTWKNFSGAFRPISGRAARHDVDYFVDNAWGKDDSRGKNEALADCSKIQNSQPVQNGEMQGSDKIQGARCIQHT